MRKPYFTVNDITKITGITRRTLHYYDEIGLLKPSHHSSQGHRLYNMSDFETLQIILFLKETDLPLKEIHQILEMPKQAQIERLKCHYETLAIKKQTLEHMMTNLKSYLSGGTLFDLPHYENSSIFPIKEQYHREAAFVYGDTAAYKNYEESLAQISPEEKAQIFADFSSEMRQIFQLFSKQMSLPPSSDDVQRIVSQWHKLFTDRFPCDGDLLICIASNYKFDNRFSTYINQFSEGDLSDFIYHSVLFYCNNLPNNI